MPPRCFNRRRNEISVTPAMGESTSGGLISISRILNGLILCIRKKPHEILPHVAFDVRQCAGAQTSCRRLASILLPTRDWPAEPQAGMPALLYQLTTNFS